MEEKVFRVAIVEDNEDDAKTVKDYCRRYGEEKGIQFNIEIHNNGFDFMSSSDLNYDIIMLDIKMPYMNGLQTAQKIRELNENVCLVFITSMQQYAIHGYSVQASDFIVKPVKYNVFSFKFDRIMSIVDKKQGKTIAIKTKGALKYLTLSEIIFVETRKHKLIFHTETGEYETWGTMKEVCNMIQSSEFALCNSCYFVNLKYVEEINNNFVIVKGNELAISRLKHKTFIDALTKIR